MAASERNGCARTWLIPSIHIVPQVEEGDPSFEENFARIRERHVCDAPRAVPSGARNGVVTVSLLLRDREAVGRLCSLAVSDEIRYFVKVISPGKVSFRHE